MHLNIVKPYHNIDIERVESKYGSKYIGSWAIIDKHKNWSEIPVEVFYQPNLLDETHSHYPGYYINDGHLFVCDAKSAFNNAIQGIMNENDGEVLISHYRHDFTGFTNGAFIDGGRDYNRTRLCDGVVPVTVVVFGGDFYVEGNKINLIRNFN